MGVCKYELFLSWTFLTQGLPVYIKAVNRQDKCGGNRAGVCGCQSQCVLYICRREAVKSSESKWLLGRSRYWVRCCGFFWQTEGGQSVGRVGGVLQNAGGFLASPKEVQMIFLAACTIHHRVLWSETFQFLNQTLI